VTDLEQFEAMLNRANIPHSRLKLDPYDDVNKHLIVVDVHGHSFVHCYCWAKFTLDGALVAVDYGY
jgi:hypothetical protein